MQKAESLTLEQMREFLAASEELDLALARRTEIYDLVERTLRKQRYLELTKKDKGVVRRYLAKLSGRSLPQITRLIRQYRQSGAVRVSQPRRRRFPTRYTADDIALLAAVDAAHEGLSGPAVRSHPVAGIHRLQQGRLPTVSLDLGIPHLQLAADRGLSSTPTSITPRPAAVG